VGEQALEAIPELAHESMKGSGRNFRKQGSRKKKKAAQRGASLLMERRTETAKKEEGGKSIPIAKKRTLTSSEYSVL